MIIKQNAVLIYFQGLAVFGIKICIYLKGQCHEKSFQTETVGV